MALSGRSGAGLGMGALMPGKPRKFEITSEFPAA
jgi:hypothetical protein